MIAPCEPWPSRRERHAIRHQNRYLSYHVTLAVLLALFAGRARAAEEPGVKGPRVFALDPQRLAEVKQRVADEAPELQPAVARLRNQADKARQLDPPSVMDKEAVPPSGDKHDYMSRGPYWWPNPNTDDGLPYVRRDGKGNRESRNLDSVPLGRMSRAVGTLALAYYLLDREPYAEHAATLLRTWFLDPATRMHPHLKYGQGIPGRCEGRGIGIIDTARWVKLIDAVGMLEGSQAWTERDQAALQEWFRAYLTWMLESSHGRAEARTRNNHGTWYDAQVAAYALFVGDRERAKRILQASATKRIAKHIQADGRQPHELRRTKGFSYSTMNLTGLFHLAALGERVGLDLWQFGPDGTPLLRRALDYLIPFATGEKDFPYKQIGGVHGQRLVPLLRRAAIAYREPSYERLIGKIDADAEADRTNLLYPKPTFQDTPAE
jgi:hypothetical protein